MCIQVRVDLFGISSNYMYMYCVGRTEPDSVEDISEELSREVFSIIYLSLVVDKFLRTGHTV